MKRLIPLLALPLSCQPSVREGGCFIVKQTLQGESTIAKLTWVEGGQLKVCQSLAQAWNRDPKVTEANARYRCDCP